MGHRTLFNRQAALALGGAGVACAAVAAYQATGRGHEGGGVSAHTFWDMLDRNVREALTDAGRRQILRDGQTYLRQGERGDRICVIMEGQMKICMVSDHGEETVLDLHGPGEIIGEMEAMDREPRVANAVAKGVTTVLTFSGDVLRGVLDEHPSVGHVLVRVLSERLRNVAQIRSTRGTRHRTATLVYQIAGRYGRATATKGEVAISPPLNRRSSPTGPGPPAARSAGR